MATVLKNSTALVIDDADYNIEYTGGWYWSLHDDEYLGGSHMTSVKGDVATYHFSGGFLIIPIT